MCSVISEMCKLLFPPYITLSNDTIGFLLFHSVFFWGGVVFCLFCFVLFFGNKSLTCPRLASNSQVNLGLLSTPGPSVSTSHVLGLKVSVTIPAVGGTQCKSYNSQ